MILPRDYLSYSAFSLWLKDKDAFRRRYYLNEKPFETVETIFGHTLHKLLEDEEEGRETRIEVELIEGLTLLGYLDSFNEETLAISDDKSGHLSPTGKPPWDAVKVRKHKQLVFYSLLVLLKYGKYNPVTTLKWHETRFKQKCHEFDGHTLCAESRELELTGRVETFTRTIEQWEIDNLKQEIIKVAEEISNDYQKFKQSNVGAGEALPQEESTTTPVLR